MKKNSKILATKIDNFSTFDFSHGMNIFFGQAENTHEYAPVQLLNK
jgi:hypothetical protein